MTGETHSDEQLAEGFHLSRRQKSDTSLKDRLRSFQSQVSGTSTATEIIRAFSTALGLIFPAPVESLLAQPQSSPLTDLVYNIYSPPATPPSVIWALIAMERGAIQPPDNLLPIMPVDEASFACVVCARNGEPSPPDSGHVVRWHLSNVPDRAQQQLLDTSVEDYIASVRGDLTARASGLNRMQEIAADYELQHTEADTPGASSEVVKQRRAKIHELRPIRLAVQNVIVGLAAVRYDSNFDGLSVEAWQTCQVPHLNVHEGSRGLAAMTLAEAFSSGGTMEIRFDDHPEGLVPSALRQFARTRGIALGSEDKQAITPSEARQLFLEITEMPDELKQRIDEVTALGRLSPERACFVMQSGIWRRIELDFLIATSPRVGSILRGGTNPLNRPEASAEQEVCRAANMIGALWARMSQLEQANSDLDAVYEDKRTLIEWTVIGDVGAVLFRRSTPSPVPWLDSETATPIKDVVVLPRSQPVDTDLAAAVEVGKRLGATAALLAPAGVPSLIDDVGVLQLTHPDRVGELDRMIEAKLLSSRVARV